MRTAEEKREARLAAGRKYRLLHREAIAARRKVWLAENKEAARAIQKKSDAKHKADRMAARRAWRAKNAVRETARTRKWVEENPEKAAAAFKKYKDANRDKLRAASRAWYAKNSTGAKQHATERKAYIKRATPKWVGPDERWLMRQAYELAAIRTKAFGFAWHVDHVVPLRGKRVCGLHVPQNLRVIPGAENQTKHAKWSA